MISNKDGSDARVVARSALEDGVRRFAFLAEPEWSPTGPQLLYTRVGGKNGIYQPSLHMIGTDGTSDRKLEGEGLSGTFSPSGDRIAFSSVHDRNGETCGSDECSYNAEIYVINADGSGRRRLTRNKGDDGAPSWSADGGRLVFASNRNYPHGFADSSELYSIGADGDCLTWLTNGTPGSEGPDWDRAGGGSTEPGGCGEASRPPLIETDLDPRPVAPFPVLWLGTSFRGQLLSYYHPGGYIGLVDYDDCARFSPAACLSEVQLQEAPLCRKKRIVLAEAGLARSYLVRRGVLLAQFGLEGGMAAYSGATYLKIYAGNLSSRSSNLQVVRALRQVGRRSDELARTAMPASLVRSLRRTRAAFERLGSVAEVAASTGAEPAAVVKKLRLERALGRYGPVRQLHCPSA